MAYNKHGRKHPVRPAAADARKELLDREKGSFLKKWTGRLPVALVYPNTYRVGMSSLGFQLVYRLLNDNDAIVCERVFLPENQARPLSVESGRPLDNFPVLFCSVSFEHDYVNIAALLLAAGLEPIAARRPDRVAPGDPLLIGGGVAAFMNPEPLAPFFDLLVIGEAEPLLPPLLELLLDQRPAPGSRSRLVTALNRDHAGFYAPSLYRPHYDDNRRFSGYQHDDALPGRIKKVVMKTAAAAAHSELLTPETEFADLYLTELGRGCTRGCRFCAAGFIYRPPRLWDREAVLQSLRQRPAGIQRVGLLGMEMTDTDSLAAVAEEMSRSGCLLSFSSLRADRISDNLLDLLSRSGLKSVAIAPDGASERLRRVINKGLNEQDLLAAAQKLVQAGLQKLKLYLMIGLPSESRADLSEFLTLLEKIHAVIDPIGQQRGRLCELVVSVNSFAPKPWTPFQYHPFGVSLPLEDGSAIAGVTAVKQLRNQISYLKKGIAGMANTRISFDNPDRVLFQAVLARGDRRLAEVLLAMAASGISFKQAMKQQGLDEELFATRQYAAHSPLPWQIIDHGISGEYLFKEYRKAFESTMTVPCDTGLCRRCGVCND